MSDLRIRRAPRPTLLFAALALSITTPSASQAPVDVQAAFEIWARKSLYRLGDMNLAGKTQDLAPIAKMLGNAKIVGLSEGVHAAAEPLEFRNRLFKHLVEREGFTGLAIESGIVESRVLNDFVTQGKGKLEDVLTRGFSVGHGTFRQNGELLLWMRDFNSRVRANADKVQIFGIDISGSPGNTDAARRPDTALQSTLDFLSRVDPDAAKHFQTRVEKFMPVLAGTNGYGELKEADRDALTAAIADLVSLFERQRVDYIGKSTVEDFEWAERAAVGARQTDSWFRRMPLRWNFDAGFAWTQVANRVRDRAMADNFEWVRSRLSPNARVLVFTATGHMATTRVKSPTHTYREIVPFGVYAKQRHGADFINILNLVVNGEIKYCSANPQRLMPLKPPPADAAENLFAAVNVPRYLLDLRRAPPAVSAWLRQVHDHWNGFFTMQFATLGAFDIVYFESPLTSACASP